MKINSGIPSSVENAAAQPAADRNQANGKGGKPAPSTSLDNVQLSGRSAELQALRVTLASGDSFDAGKVNSIKAAVRDGTLAINTEVVADRLLASAMSLLGKTTQ